MSLSLTIWSVFTLVFETSGTEKVEYQGETAFKLSNESNTITDKKLYLINDYRVRIVVGGDEELGSRCLDYYFGKLKKKMFRFTTIPAALAGER